MSAALDLKSAAALSQIYRNEELLPNWKVPAFQTSKFNLKRLLLFYILCEEFRSYIGLHKFPGEEVALCISPGNKT